MVRFHAISSSVVWVLSAQFHARDTVLSERLDYFGAILLVYCTFTIVYARQLFRFDFTSWLLLLPLTCFILHIYYLFYILPKFDFGLNMQVCVLLGLCTVALQLFTYLTDRQNYSIYQVQYKLACLSVFSSAALTLEVFDFAPIMGHIDSHALWHAVTIPVPLLYYQLVLHDYQLILDDKLKLL